MTAPGGPVRPYDVVVVAAGSSRRMGGVDKLETMIGPWPVLGWTVRALAAAPGVRAIAIAVAPDRVRSIADAPWLPDAVTAVVPGGVRRQESVAAAFEALDPPDDRVVLVHDGARPAIRPELVGSIAREAERHGAAVPTLAIADTVKRVADGVIVETVERAGLVVVQTPQGVRAGLLRAAWAVAPPGGPATFTDEAGLLEVARIPVHAILGDAENLKVTVPADLDRVRAVLGGAGVDRGSERRVGFGIDSHPFGPGAGLALGGTTIDDAPRLHGHSDGDVVLHAIADALLGAAGLGDLGRLFPADETTPQGVASSVLLRRVVDRLRDAGWEPAAVDVTIIGARPRLGPTLDAMSEAIGAIVGLPRGLVAVKASTGNLDGMTGAGRGIAAHAVTTIRPAAGDPGGTAGGGAGQSRSGDSR